jgi:hypothetical protein
MDTMLRYIKENYKTKTKREIATILDLTTNQVEWIMKKNNIRKYRSKKYTEYELDFIKNNYPKHGSKYCAIKLGRSENAINKKIKKMGLSIDWKYEYISQQGYLVNCEDRNNKYEVHRRVMEEKLGRKLTSDEIVHHIDGNKLNNNPDNLELTTRSGHIKKHRKDLIKNQYKI